MNTIKLTNKRHQQEIIEDIEFLSGQNLYACYQCGKCTAGCPLAFSMDILPHQIVRLLQFDNVQPVFDSNTFWHCASCFTCTSRCPKGLDLARVMEALRTIFIREGKAPLQVFPPPVELLAAVPQQASVSAFRKMTG